MVDIRTTEPLAGETVLSLEGFWRSRGYGWILSIDSGAYALFDCTQSACIEFERGTGTDFHAGFEVLDTEGTEHLSLRVRNDITRYDFDRIAALPVNTLFLDAPRNPNPLDNLEFFCEVFAQDYAFFSLRGVDWDAASIAARSRIDAGSTAEALFVQLFELIKPLTDNHVVLSDGQKVVRSERTAEQKAIIREGLELDDPNLGNPESVSKVSDFLKAEFLGDTGTCAGNGAFNWGMVSPKVGYLAVLRLFGLADTPGAGMVSDLPSARADHARLLRDDLQATEEIMDRVMADLAGSEAMIVDVRLNGGGFDSIGMAIASRFTDRLRLAFTKHARRGDGVTPKQEFYLHPTNGRPFLHPVYVLTSARTPSAGDVFALCMHCLPQTTLVGQPSTGILSDNLKKHLPNGWTTSISNEYYCSAGGRLYEGSGVPVDVKTPVFVKDDFIRGYHRAVNKALELASKDTGSECR